MKPAGAWLHLAGLNATRQIHAVCSKLLARADDVGARLVALLAAEVGAVKSMAQDLSDLCLLLCAILVVDHKPARVLVHPGGVLHKERRFN